MTYFVSGTYNLNSIDQSTWGTRTKGNQLTHIHLENDHYNGGGGNGGGGVCMHVYYELSTLFSRQHASVICIQRQDLVCIFWHVYLFFFTFVSYSVR